MVFVAMVMVMACSKDNTHSATSEFRTLDSLLAAGDDINREKIVELSNLTKKRDMAYTASDRYMTNRLLYEAYMTYQSDSALKYIEQNRQIANQTGNTDWQIRSSIDKAGLLAATGLLSQSVDVMNTVDRSKLPDDMLVDYYGQWIFIYSHYGNYTEGFPVSDEFYVRERTYKDSIMQVIKPSHPEYLWYKGWDALGTDKDKTEIIKALEEKLQDARYNTHQEAKDAYILAKMYESVDDPENYKKYMALSATADVRMANAEISSLEDLAKTLFNEGDIDHAFSYINYSLNKAIQLPNRVKAYGITSTLGSVYDAYKAKSASQQQRTRASLIVVCLLVVILVIFTIVIRRQNRKLNRQRNSLDEMNRNLSSNNHELAQAQQLLNDANLKLQELNTDLRQKNEELKEANYVKEEYIGYVFTICASYIGKLESLKAKVHNKVVTHQYKELEKETAIIDSKDELKNFYRSFDSIFLHIYPEFVEDFNSLLQEDKHIYPKDGELLNTELRIYALVRLGITDSVKIADFLHCSAQTVYNYRFKVRNRARIPREEFAEAVRKLGTFSADI